MAGSQCIATCYHRSFYPYPASLFRTPEASQKKLVGKPEENKYFVPVRFYLKLYLGEIVYHSGRW